MTDVRFKYAIGSTVYHFGTEGRVSAYRLVKGECQYYVRGQGINLWIPEEYLTKTIT
jgi:hypothetical protein